MTDDLLVALVMVGFILVLVLLALELAPAKRPEPEPDETEADTPTADEAVEDELEAELREIIEEAPPAPPEPKVSRLGRGLAKTRSALSPTLRSLRLRDKLDAEDWDEIEEALIRADVGVDAAGRVLSALRERKPSPEELPEALRSQLVGILDRGDRQLALKEGEPSVWLVIGVNGVGKTTSIAKLANRLQGEGRSVVLVAGDTFRAAAVEQLGTWAERLGVHMVKHDANADPGAVVFDAIEHAKAKKVDVVIVDTAGRLHTKSNLMEELKKVRRIADKKSGGVAEALLVLDATVGQNGLAQARAFQEALGATGVILTKLDGTAKGGIVIAIQQELGIPVKAVGVGEGIEDLEPFDPERFVEALLE